MKLNANTEAFEVVEFLGKRALFTSVRIDRETVPDGVYCYDVRHADEDGMVGRLSLHPYRVLILLEWIVFGSRLKALN